VALIKSRVKEDTYVCSETTNCLSHERRGGLVTVVKSLAMVQVEAGHWLVL
jgi:hypothetical protein